jgi:organic radical activating enzyme
VIKDNGVMCTFPFIQFSTTVEGKYQTCCIAKPDDKMTFENTSPMEFFNSSKSKQLRHDMANGIMSDLVKKTCQTCHEQEKQYGSSKRLDSLKHHIHGHVPIDTIDKVKKSNDVDLKPKDIDHLKMKVFGNICNLKCTMCSVGCSSALASELKRYDEWKGETVVNPYKKIDKDKLYADLEEICPVVREFEIVGGEPLMMKDSIEMLEWMVSKGYSKTMEFRIITNATVDNWEYYRLMKYFKKATFIVSLDAYGKKDEYIRSGEVWEEKVEIIKNFIRADIDVSWSNTIQLLNIGYLDEIHIFYEQLKEIFPHINKVNSAKAFKNRPIKRGGVSIPYLNNLLTYPYIMLPKHLPKQIKEKYIEKYERSNVLFEHKQRWIKALKSVGYEKDFMRTMAHYKFFDEKRGTNLLNEWPEFETWYSKADSYPYWREYEKDWQHKGKAL